MIGTGKSIKLALVCCTLLFFAHGAAAFTVGSVSVDPSGNLYPGDSVTVSYTVYAAYGTAFPSYDDLQFITGLDDPRWTYSVVVNGVKNTRPVTGGRTLSISGFELGYEDKDDVNIQVALQGTIPKASVLGVNKTLVKIQELDARGYSIANSVVNIDRLIGEPTPLPTLAFGSIAVTSFPSGADIYIDNVYKGLSPAVFSNIPNGNHVVLLKRDGYQDLTKSVTVTADNQTFHGALTQGTVPIKTTSYPGPTLTDPAQANGFGSLSITTIPAGALVYVDGSMRGVTPTTIPMLTEGSHSVTLILDGYQDLKTTITINAGTTSEYITGLSKTTKAPGFAAITAAFSVGGLLLYRNRRA